MELTYGEADDEVEDLMIALETDLIKYWLMI